MLNTTHMRKPGQQGAALIESMIAVLIISFGILAIVGMQATAIQASTDTRFRAEAIYLVDRLVGQMLLNIDRSSAAATQNSISTFIHNPDDSEVACQFDGVLATNTIVNNWIDTVVASGSGLPGTTEDRIQIKLDTTANAGNRLIITVRWQAPWETQCHQHSTVAYIN